ncbi:MAG: hypothetical protein H2174_09200 [Vampirovibrio sp.]|nr:hypothetical protein [Vampirovibrio sp.]
MYTLQKSPNAIPRSSVGADCIRPFKVNSFGRIQSAPTNKKYFHFDSLPEIQVLIEIIP